MSKNISIILVIVILAVGGWWLYSSQKGNEAMINEEQMESPSAEKAENSSKENENTEDNMVLNSHISELGIMEGGITLTDGNNALTHVMPYQIVDLQNSSDSVKEVTMTSYASMIDNKPAPRFSIKEITVKKGDSVKINVTVTSGAHNFNIDEYNIHENTPLDEQVTIEFTADKAGKFIYYCSMPGHRGNGHWGVLNVVE